MPEPREVELVGGPCDGMRVKMVSRRVTIPVESNRNRTNSYGETRPVIKAVTYELRGDGKAYLEPRNG